MFLFSLTCSLFLLTSFGHASTSSEMTNLVRRMSPTISPATDEPTVSPTTSPTTYPTDNPSAEPVFSTGATPEPTTSPTTSPTTYPTDSPIDGGATPEPTTSPTTSPTTFPTDSPTMEPTGEIVLEDSDSDGSGMSTSSVLGMTGGLFIVLVMVVVAYLLSTGKFAKKASQRVMDSVQKEFPLYPENQENLETNNDYTATTAGGDGSPSMIEVTQTPGAGLNVPPPTAQNPTSDSDFVSPRKMPTPKESKKDTSHGSGRSSENRVSLGLVSMMSPKKIKNWTTKDDGEQPSSPLMGSSAKGNNVTSLADIEAVLTGRDPKDFK